MRRILTLLIKFILFIPLAQSQTCDSLFITRYQRISSPDWSTDSVRIDSFQNGLLQSESFSYPTDTSLNQYRKNEYTYDSLGRLYLLDEFLAWNDSTWQINQYVYHYTPSNKISWIDGYHYTDTTFTHFTNFNYLYDSNDSLILYTDFNGSQHQLSYTYSGSGTDAIDSVTGFFGVVYTYNYDTNDILMHSNLLSFDGFETGGYYYLCNGLLSSYHYEYNSGSIHDHVWSNGNTVFDNCIPQFEYFTIIDIGILDGDYRIAYDYATCHSISIIAPDTMSFCYDEPENLFISFYGGRPPYTYNWFPLTGLSSDTVLNPLVVQALDTAYTLTITDSAGLSFSKSIKFIIHPEPNAHIDIASIDSASVCNTAILTFDSIGGGDGCTWYLDGNLIQYSHSTDDSLFINHNGNYSIVINSDLGCTATDSLPFNGLTNSAPTISVADTCNTLYAFSNDTVQYQWLWYNTVLNGSVYDTLHFTNNGSYSVIATNSLGCSDTTFAHYYPVYRLLHSTYVMCDSSCMGNASVNSSTNIQSVIWSNGDTIQYNHNLCPGPFSVTVTDSRGCVLTVTDTMKVNGPQLTIDSIRDASCAGCNDGIIYFTLTGGTPPYHNYSGPGIYYTSQIANVDPGNYYISFQDHNGCEVGDSVTVDVNIAVKEFSVNDLLIYPNPVSGILHLKNLPVNANVEVKDSYGRIFYLAARDNEYDIDLSKAEQGVYFLQLNSPRFLYTSKILVEH
jgi:hypothetical protein